MENNQEHLQYLDSIAKDDAKGVAIAEAQYGSSWKQRGGVGAFMMLARKWDRIEQRVKTALSQPGVEHPNTTVPPYDIFGHIRADPRSEGVIDDIRDLRRYLLLVEAEMISQGAEAAQSEHRDNYSAGSAEQDPQDLINANQPGTNYVNQDPDDGEPNTGAQLG